MPAPDALAYSGETPWNGLAMKMDRLMSIDEAYGLTMNWKVREQNLYIAVGDESVRVPGYKAIVRDDNNDVLAVMNGTYSVFQNDEHAEFLRRVLGARGDKPVVEAAGVLGRGRRVWMLCHWSADIRASDDDRVETYLLSATSHDGSLKHAMLPISLRVANQSTLVASAKKSAGIQVRHTTKMEERVREAQRAIKATVADFDEYRAEVSTLARAKFTRRQMGSLTEHLFPPTPVQKDGMLLRDTTHVSARNQEARDLLMHLFENGHGQETCRGTAWAAMQAICEFTDHYRQTRVTQVTERDERAVREARLQSVWFGASRDLKLQARNHIHEDI
jgi:phage/plasmid-like protein (TIGR03299 family)